MINFISVVVWETTRKITDNSPTSRLGSQSSPTKGSPLSIRLSTLLLLERDREREGEGEGILETLLLYVDTRVIYA